MHLSTHIATKEQAQIQQSADKSLYTGFSLHTGLKLKALLRVKNFSYSESEFS